MWRRMEVRHDACSEPWGFCEWIFVQWYPLLQNNQHWLLCLNCAQYPSELYIFKEVQWVGDFHFCMLAREIWPESLRTSEQLKFTYEAKIYCAFKELNNKRRYQATEWTGTISMPRNTVQSWHSLARRWLASRGDWKATPFPRHVQRSSTSPSCKVQESKIDLKDPIL